MVCKRGDADLCSRKGTVKKTQVTEPETDQKKTAKKGSLKIRFRVPKATGIDGLSASKVGRAEKPQGNSADTDASVCKALPGAATSEGRKDGTSTVQEELVAAKSIMRNRIQVERAAARRKLEELERSVDVEDNIGVLCEFEALIGCTTRTWYAHPRDLDFQTSQL